MLLSATAHGLGVRVENLRMRDDVRGAPENGGKLASWGKHLLFLKCCLDLVQQCSSTAGRYVS